MKVAIRYFSDNEIMKWDFLICDFFSDINRIYTFRVMWKVWNDLFIHLFIFISSVDLLSFASRGSWRLANDNKCVVHDPTNLECAFSKITVTIKLCPICFLHIFLLYVPLLYVTIYLDLYICFTECGCCSTVIANVSVWVCVCVNV